MTCVPQWTLTDSRGGEISRSKKLEAFSRKIKRDYWCSPSKRLKDPREMLAEQSTQEGRAIWGAWSVSCGRTEKAPAQKAWIMHMCTASLLLHAAFCPWSRQVFAFLSSSGDTCLWKPPEDISKVCFTILAQPRQVGHQD